MKKPLSILIFLMVNVQTFAQTPKEKILVTDLQKLKPLGAVHLSPDGKKAIYNVQTLETNETDKLDSDYRLHLWLTDFQSSKAITRGNVSARQASFSPDGKSLAFVRNVKSTSQIFVMPLDGGEAYQLTDLKYGASSPRWSIDGTKILFSTSLSMSDLLKDSLFNPRKELPRWSLEKPGFKDNAFLMPDKKIKANPNGSIEEIRAYLSKDEEDKKAKVFNRLNFQGEASTQTEFYFSHLMMIDVKENAKAYPLTKGFWSYDFATWLPNDKGFLATCGTDTLQHPDREQASAIVSFNTDGRGLKYLIADKTMNYNSPEISPDGKTMAFTGSKIGTMGYGNLFVAKADGSDKIMIDFDRSAGNLTWSKDGKFLYFVASSNGGNPLYRLDIQTKKIEQLTDFESGITSFDVGADKIVFVKTEVSNPAELYVADLQMKNAKVLTTHNSEWLKNKALSFPEKRSFKNEKGQLIEYWIMKPSQMESGKKYPLLLNMHGGPTAMWGPGEASMWHEHQYFCANGYGVVYANPRGSGGYGKDFQWANYQDWGTGPANDVLAACADAAKESWADTARQVITGGSYAGYLTAWIISHDHRFKAAFAQRGVYDLKTFMGEGNAWRLVPNYFGLPWIAKDMAIINRESPYSYVQNIKTPFLIKHGENDLRTGVIQSEMMYKTLKYLGKEVEYVRMPGGTHELSRSGNVRQRVDRLLRIYEFFERYVR